LLKIPGLMLAGGLGLLWVAYNLLAEDGDDEHSGPMANTFWGAMKTIIVADALMGVDNVLGVAGAAHGAMDLVIIGLLVSVPIVVLGSSVVLKLVERFPSIITLGAAVLAFTAAQMLVSEPWLADYLGHAKAGLTQDQQWLRWAIYATIVTGVVLAGRWRQRQAASAKA
jgi:YjbE family integral membrane protein